jgi:glycosyltransferase involved in cell wall biosynthesis
MAEHSDLVIAHDHRAIEHFNALYPCVRRPILMSHGNYAGAFPTPSTRAHTFATHGLDPELPLFVAVGAIRPYKGFDLPARTAPLLKGRVQVLIAGADRTGKFVKEYQGTPNLHLIGSSISDQSFADLVHAADGVLLPYLDITGSGALLAALTLGTGVVVSDLPYFRDLLKLHPLAGTVLQKRTPAALAKAIQDFLELGAEARGQAATELASRFDWDDVVADVRTELRRWRTEMHLNTVEPTPL